MGTSDKRIEDLLFETKILEEEVRSGVVGLGCEYEGGSKEIIKGFIKKCEKKRIEERGTRLDAEVEYQIRNGLRKKFRDVESTTPPQAPLV